MIRQLTDADYLRFRDLARGQTGLEFAESRRPDLERAVFNALATTGLPDPDALYSVLTTSTNGQRAVALEALIGGLTVCETHFFRNRPQFEALERSILPEIIGRRRDSRTLRLWSAGCASGEEPYSLAILLQRLLPDLARWNVLILATDVNRQVLAKARRGVYGAWSFREVPQEIHEGYFIRRGREYEVTPRTRELVTFAYLNLVADSYPLPLNNPQGAFGSATNMDLILCRNVLIYFNQETTRNVVGRLYDSLADGGWLIVGHAEPSQEVFRAFVTRNFPDTVVYQKRQTNVQPLSVDAPPMSLLPALCPLPAVCVAPVKANVQPMSPPGNGNRYHKGAAQSSFQMPLSATTPRPAAAFVAPTGRPANGQGQPEDSQSSYRAAKLHANRLQLDAAEAQIKIALERAPLMAPAHHLHGMILAEQGRLDEALAALRRCIYADSQFVLGQYALADLLARMGQAGRAEKVRETVRRLLDRYRPDDPIPEGDGLTAGQLLEMLKTHNSFGTDPGPQPAYSET